MKTLKKTKSIQTVRHITVFSVNWKLPQSHKRSILNPIPESRFPIKNYSESDFQCSVNHGPKFRLVFKSCVMIYLIVSMFLSKNETFYALCHD